MPVGLLFMRESKENPRGYTRGDFVCSYPAQKCRDNPAAASPFNIVIVSDADEQDIAQLVTPQRNVDGSNRLSRSTWTFSPPALPARAQNELTASRRCIVTWEEMLDATFKKENGFTARVNGVQKAAR
jgi:hypothetical protein